MTTTIKRDPLLAAARILLILLIGILGFAAVFMTIAFPALLIFPEQAIAAMTTKGVTNGHELIPALAFVIAAVAGLVALAIYFLVLLYRIVRSVGESDPFAPVNAVRLVRMAWISLVGQIASMLVALAGIWIGEEIGEQANNMHLVAGENFDIDPSGILLVLTLFILARVFRHGAAMRQDLEGTV